MGKPPVEFRFVKVTPGTMAVAQTWYYEAQEWATTSSIEQAEGYLWNEAFTRPGSVWRVVERCDAETSGTAHFTFWVPVGLMGYENINAIDRVCSPLIVVRADERRKGYGKVIAEMMRDFAWRELNARRIQTSVLTDAPSKKLLEHLHFEREGVSKAVRYRNGEYVDVEHYALMRS